MTTQTKSDGEYHVCSVLDVYVRNPICSSLAPSSKAVPPSQTQPNQHPSGRLPPPVHGTLLPLRSTNSQTSMRAGAFMPAVGRTRLYQLARGQTQPHPFISRMQQVFLFFVESCVKLPSTLLVDGWGATKINQTSSSVSQCFARKGRTDQTNACLHRKSSKISGQAENGLAANCVLTSLV